MKFVNEFQHIRDWAKSKGLLDKGDAKTQIVKLGEEFGELCSAVNKGDKFKAADAIGDCIIVLTSIAHHMGWTIEECINAAYTEIAGRTGSMVNGDFVKDK